METKRIALLAAIGIALSLGSISYVMASCNSCNNFKFCTNGCVGGGPGGSYMLLVATDPYWGCVGAPDFPEFSCDENGPVLTCGSLITKSGAGCTGQTLGTGEQTRRMGEGDDCD